MSDPNTSTQPPSVERPLASVILTSLSDLFALTKNIFALLLPFSVIFPPPLITVLIAMTFALVTVSVYALAPQLKSTLPPPTNRASSAASVQLAGVPVPTVPPSGAARTLSAESANAPAKTMIKDRHSRRT